LSLNLKAVISQRLLPTTDNKLVPAIEILIQSAYISSLIEKREIEEIKQAIEKSREEGMQTFDQSLYDLYKQGKITKELALQHADSSNNLSIKINLEEGTEKTAEGDALNLQSMNKEDEWRKL